MVDIASITASLEAFRFAKRTVESVLDKQIDESSKAQINEALSKLGEVQEAMFTMREQLLSLQEDNRQLKHQIYKNDKWEEKIAKYELTETTGKAVVYVSKDSNPKHYICPSCVENQSIQILQNNRTSSGKYTCKGCKSEYPVEPRIPDPPINYPNPRRPF